MVDVRKTDPGNEEDLKKSVMDQLERVLAASPREKSSTFSLSSASSVSRNRGGSLLAFAGSIPKGDLAEMRRTIEEGCEKVDEEEW